MSTITTEKMIKDLTVGMLGAGPWTREKYIFEQAMLGLVRLAKVEQRMERSRSVDKTSRSATLARRETSALLRRLATSAVQHELKFDFGAQR